MPVKKFLNLLVTLEINYDDEIFIYNNITSWATSMSQPDLSLKKVTT